MPSEPRGMGRWPLCALAVVPTTLAVLGGLVVLGAGILLRRRGCAAGALGAHAACAIGMIVGLLLCVLPLPVPLLLTGEMTLTVALALFLRRFLAAPRLASAQ